MAKKHDVNILAYQYEPEYKDGEESEFEEYDDNMDLSFQDLESRPELKNWCSCGNCVIMPTKEECMCCLELDEVKYFKLEGKHDK